jgi:VTC domain
MSYTTIGRMSLATDTPTDVVAHDLDDDLPPDTCRVGLELKFAVTEAKAGKLLVSLRNMLEPDPYGGPNGEYEVMSLYLDTPELDAYHRTVEHKWRVRRYGSSERLFAELKAKPESGRVVKRRTEFAADQLARLVDRDGPAKWFSKQISRNNLSTTRLVGYRRNAFVGEIEGEPMRITLDCDIVAVEATELVMPAQIHDGMPLGVDRILEVKFANDMPKQMATTLEKLELLAGSFSKYRQAIELL